MLEVEDHRRLRGLINTEHVFIIDRELIQGKFIDLDNNVLTVNWSKKQCSAEK